MPESVELQLNGQPCRWPLDDNLSLLDALREQGWQGTRFGCGLGQCGACNVQVEGQAVHACDTRLWQVRHKAVVTVEALHGEVPHPLVQAFEQEQAGQCGYCLSGILMSAKTLLEHNPDPTDAEIRQALDGNLGRCGSHLRIVRAVRRAATQLRAAVPSRGA